MKKRDTTRYELYDHGRMVYAGITNDLNRRTAEHRQEGMDFTSVRKVGPTVTRDTANQWEDDRISTYKANHGGNRPKYNQNDSGK